MIGFKKKRESCAGVDRHLWWYDVPLAHLLHPPYLICQDGEGEVEGQDDQVDDEVEFEDHMKSEWETHGAMIPGHVNVKSYYSGQCYEQHFVDR